MPSYSMALRNRKLDAISAEIGDSGILRIYDDAAEVPQSPDQPIPKSAQILAEFQLAAPFAPKAKNARLQPTLPADVNAIGTGKPGWYRVSKRNGNGVIDSSASDLAVDGSVAFGLPVRVRSWVYVDNNGA